MADISTFESAKDWLLLAVVGLVGALAGLIRRSDVSRLEDKIDTVRAADLALLKLRVEKLEEQVKELSGESRRPPGCSSKQDPLPSPWCSRRWGAACRRDFGDPLGLFDVPGTGLAVWALVAARVADRPVPDAASA